MLYTELLRHGHWKDFLDYLWQNTDCVKRSGYRSSLLWSQSVSGKEEEQLNILFAEDKGFLIEQVDKYFEQVSERHPTEYCLRCNRSFKLQNTPDCQLCGWDYDAAYQSEFSKAVIEINGHINAQYIDKQLSLFRDVHRFDSLDMQAKRWSSKSDCMEEREVSLKKELEALQLAAQVEKSKRENLERRLEAQLGQIKQLERLRKNTESLFLTFDDHQPGHALRFFIKGYILHVLTRPSLQFPIDLIMGLQKVDDGPPVKTINKTCCFLFIHEDQWTQVNDREWKVDLSEIAKDKVSGDFYVNCFSHLHKKDHLTNISYDIKRLTFM
jgi:hypothetical protein